MVFKTPSTAPLETIYEESGSFVASTADMYHQPNNHQQLDTTITGLISARSVPPVTVQRQSGHKNQRKPPIEVRYRDGSKRFIKPVLTTTMTRNRQHSLDCSYDILPSNQLPRTKYQQLINFNSNKRKRQSKPPLVITIITAEDLHEANVSPSLSSSPTETSASTPSQPRSNASSEKLRTGKETRRG